MNELIQQLAEQCWDYGRGTVNTKKFADLLLFECIKLATFRGDIATAKAIKEHFGVE